jgi:hypothetical protein
MQKICGTLEGMWKEAVDILFEVIYWHFLQLFKKTTKSFNKESRVRNLKHAQQVCNPLGRHVM